MRPSARLVAATVLVRVFRDQAFASAALDAELERAAQLDPRDRRLATELVYGALRVRPYLETQIGRHTRDGIDALDPVMRAHLLVASYQVVFLDRIPPFAAVSEAVTLVRKARGVVMSRFANAVLRKLSQHRERWGPASIETAVRDSTPPWFIDRLTQALGSQDAAQSFVLAGPWPPSLCLRVRRAEDRDVWISRLAEALPSAEIAKGKMSPLCILLRGAGRLQSLPGFGSAAWLAQEEGSQFLGLAVGARSGERVLDACAGRGNKTSLLAERVGLDGQLDAADLHTAKLEVLKRQVSAAGAQLHETFAVDWAVGCGDVPEGYDRVLVDAPCSGTGTLRRRPDLLLRDLSENLRELPTMQSKILMQAASRCRPGGRVIYAVCSVLREEAEDVVQAALASCPWLCPVPFDSDDVKAHFGDAAMMRLLPHEHGTDGYFLACLERQA